MLQGNPNGPNYLKLLQVGLRSKRTTVQTIQIVQTVQTIQIVQTVQTALCWLQNFDCFISRDTDKFIHDLSRKRFTVLCGYFNLREKLFYAPVDVK